MKKNILFSLVIFILLIYHNSLLTNEITNQTFIPSSNTITIGINPASNYNVSGSKNFDINEIDVAKSTNFTMFFHNPYPNYPQDLVILKPGLYVTTYNCSNISSNYYDLKLGPISNSTVNGTWKSPNFDTWIIFYNSEDTGCGGAGTYHLFKVGNPTQKPGYFVFISQSEPGFESYIVIGAMIGFILIRKRFHNR